MTVSLLCVAEWTHKLASELAHTTSHYGKDERRTKDERDNENEPGGGATGKDLQCSECRPVQRGVTSANYHSTEQTGDIRPLYHFQGMAEQGHGAIRNEYCGGNAEHGNWCGARTRNKKFESTHSRRAQEKSPHRQVGALPYFPCFFGQGLTG